MKDMHYFAYFKLKTFKKQALKGLTSLGTKDWMYIYEYTNFGT